MREGPKTAVVILALMVLAAAAGFLLSRADAQVPSTTLIWTAPGDDGNVGTATVYGMRFSRTPVGADTSAWWNQATLVPALPNPSLAGAQDSVRVFWPTWNATYYAIVTACDEVPNCSGWSNVYRVTVGAAPDVTPPWRITDLHAR